MTREQIDQLALLLAEAAEDCTRRGLPKAVKDKFRDPGNMVRLHLTPAVR